MHWVELHEPKTITNAHELVIYPAECIIQKKIVANVTKFITEMFDLTEFILIIHLEQCEPYFANCFNGQHKAVIATATVF